MSVSAISGFISGSDTAGSTTQLADNFETFLTLLTEQMKNQDPLSPMDSTEFVNQLVQFSSVEQQINQNNNIETLIGLQLAASQAGAASYLGREVTMTTPLAELEGGEASWTYKLGSNAHEGKLLIENTEGKLVHVVDAELGAGKHEFVWDGKDALGAQLPDGVYRMSVAALDEAGGEISATIESRGRVTAVDFGTGEPMVYVNQVGASLADILSLREIAPEDGA